MLNLYTKSCYNICTLPKYCPKRWKNRPEQPISAHCDLDLWPTTFIFCVQNIVFCWTYIPNLVRLSALVPEILTKTWKKRKKNHGKKPDWRNPRVNQYVAKLEILQHNYDKICLTIDPHELGGISVTSSEEF